MATRKYQDERMTPAEGENTTTIVEQEDGAAASHGFILALLLFIAVLVVYIATATWRNNNPDSTADTRTSAPAQVQESPRAQATPGTSPVEARGGEQTATTDTSTDADEADTDAVNNGAADTTDDGTNENR